MSRQTESVLNNEQWAQLEYELFSDAGEALVSIRDWARGRLLPPVGAVVMSAHRVLSAVPAGTTFDAGGGSGSLNTLVALVGRPGQGKDRLAAAVAGALVVTDGRGLVHPVEAALGSGEGVAARCAPERGPDAQEDDPGTPPTPVIFGESEAGKVETLMNRQGSTLRQTIMSIYSGNALGSSNKNEQMTVPRNSYTAGLWVGVQPDKAGALLGGADDGLAHRFIWTELVDPFAVDEHSSATLRAVCLPDGLKREGVTFPQAVVEQTRKALYETVKFGARGNHHGHRHQTRLKLAAGLALLRSDRVVNMDDWHRAGVLMDYSDRVRAWCLDHLEQQIIVDEAKRVERRDQADDEVHRNRVERNRRRILEALADDSTQDPVKWSPLMQARPSRERGAMSEALQQLINAGAVEPLADADGRTDALAWGPVFTTVCTQEGVSYAS